MPRSTRQWAPCHSSGSVDLHRRERQERGANPGARHIGTIPDRALPLRLPRSLVHKHQWILDQATKRLEEFRADSTVNDAVIAAHGEADALANHLLAVDHHNFFLTRTDGDDRGLGWIDDRREVVDAEHAEVAHGERRA